MTVTAVNVNENAVSKYKLSWHIRESQAAAIKVRPDYILAAAENPTRTASKPNHPHQYELQKDLPCGYTLAMAVDPTRLPDADMIATVYPKGITRTHAQELGSIWARGILEKARDLNAEVADLKRRTEQLREQMEQSVHQLLEAVSIFNDDEVAVEAADVIQEHIRVLDNEL